MLALELLIKRISLDRRNGNSHSHPRATVTTWEISWRSGIYDFRDIALEGLRFSAAYCLRGMKNISRANTQGLIDAPSGAQVC